MKFKNYLDEKVDLTGYKLYNKRGYGPVRTESMEVEAAKEYVLKNCRKILGYYTRTPHRRIYRGLRSPAHL